MWGGSGWLWGGLIGLQRSGFLLLAVLGCFDVLLCSVVVAVWSGGFCGVS